MEQKSYTYKYPHPAVTADNVIFAFDGKDLNILLIKRKIAPYKDCWAFPGGFMNIDETIEECAKRELQEETNFKVERMEQMMCFSSVHRDPRERVITIAFFALVKMQEVKAGDDALEAKWFKLKDVPSLAFDHDYILRIALTKLKERVHFEPICFELLDKEFTMTELQRLYEAILGVHFDRRNFFRKMQTWGILDRVGDDNSKNEENEDFSLDFSENTTHNKKLERMKKIRNLLKQGSNSTASIQMNDLGTMEISLSENISIDDIKEEKHRPSRIPYKYTFNKERYENKKQDGFKIEF